MSPTHLAELVAAVIIFNAAIGFSYGYFLGRRKGRK